MPTTSRLFTRPDLPALLAFISENAARAPRRVYLMTSDVAWRLPGSGPKQNIRLWFDAAGLAGYVWFEPIASMEFDVRHDLDYGHPIVPQMFAWAHARRREFTPAYPRFIDLTSMEAWANEVAQPRSPQSWEGHCLTTVALESDTMRVELLQRIGYEATQHFAPDYRRDLAVPIPASGLNNGMTLRHVAETDIDERVACHRAAWLRSTWSKDAYLQIRASDCYDHELDVVLETAAGVFVGYCLCWADYHAGVGSFEPVGTRPQWRGRGVGREIIYEGLRRLKAKGMYAARVGTAGFNMPAQALYEGCGFERIDVSRTFMKRIEQ